MRKIAIIGFLFLSIFMLTACQTSKTYASDSYQNNEVNTFNTIHKSANYTQECIGSECLKRYHDNTPREIELDANVNERFRCEGCREEINILDGNDYGNFEIIENNDFNPKVNQVKTKYCTNNHACPVQTINGERGRYSCLNEVCKPCNFQSDCSGTYNYCSPTGLCTKWD